MHLWLFQTVASSPPSRNFFPLKSKSGQVCNRFLFHLNGCIVKYVKFYNESSDKVSSWLRTLPCYRYSGKTEHDETWQRIIFGLLWLWWNRRGAGSRVHQLLAVQKQRYGQVVSMQSTAHSKHRGSIYIPQGRAIVLEEEIHWTHRGKSNLSVPSLFLWVSFYFFKKKINTVAKYLLTLYIEKQNVHYYIWLFFKKLEFPFLSSRWHTGSVRFSAPEFEHHTHASFIWSYSAD